MRIAIKILNSFIQTSTFPKPSKSKQRKKVPIVIMNPLPATYPGKPLANNQEKIIRTVQNNSTSVIVTVTKSTNCQYQTNYEPKFQANKYATSERGLSSNKT